jgi:hypothetical protein
MRVELLFLRWLAGIAVVAVAILYATSGREKQEDPRYETLPLVHGGRSSGMPLAGIMVDPAKKDIFAVVGGPSARASGNKNGFFIVWKGEDGRNYATTFRRGESQADALFEISRNREIRPIFPFEGSPENPQVMAKLADAQKMLRSFFDGLPPYAGSVQQ